MKKRPHLTPIAVGQHFLTTTKETEMRTMTISELEHIQAGNKAIGCFFAGVIFGAALGAGQIYAAAGAGFYLAANCFG
jgi:hypothetical protein